MNKKKLLLNMSIKIAMGFVLMGALLFGCAGTFNYWNAWLFLASIGVPMIGFGARLFFKDTATLERRLMAKEPDKSQLANIALSAFMFIATFLLAGLDRRFAWSALPIWGSLLALAFLLLGYGLYAAVIVQNSYAARVVDVFENQTVTTTGLYAVVRHPMYLATLLLYGSMPLLLGSWVACLPILIYPVVLVRRIANEEALLLRELEGYRAYTEQTKYRLLPFLW